MLERFESLPLPQQLVMLFLALAFVGGGYYFIIIGSIEARKSQARNTELQAEKRLQSLKRYEDDSQFKLLEQERKDVEDQLLANRALLPDDDKLPTLITRIKRQADERGLKILRFSRKDHILDDWVSAVPVEIAVEGSFPVIISFLEALAQPGMRMMTVADLKLMSQPIGRFLDDDKAGAETDTVALGPLGLGGEGDSIGGEESIGGGPSLSPALELLAKLDDFEDARDRYQMRALFTVNAYSYTGRPLSAAEKAALRTQRTKRKYY